MKIRAVEKNKKQYLALLLLADEQESMIDRYLERGRMYTLDDGGVKAVCVVTDEGNGVLEIKNIAVDAEYQRRGFGRALVSFIEEKYRRSFHTLRVGTGDSPATVPFYEKCGFERAFVIRDFFTDNYDRPIYDGGVRLKDMLVLEKKI